MMSPYFQNQSCDPFTPLSQACELGNYASYSINVTCVYDAVAGVHFTRENNIRLVMKTTGHDYIGRSTGPGSLSLWMWHLKTADPIYDYQSSWYSGPAIKIGAGMTAAEVYAAVVAIGYRVVGGECPTVAIAGGYSQGGGHSMLSTAYGMASDQVLEWEVITADGEHLIATPEKNTDLYWALSGGGAGNYAVVLSMTARMYPDGPVGGASLRLANTNETAYWEAVSQWLQLSPGFVGTSNTLIFMILNSVFEAFAITLPDQPSSNVYTLLAPYTSKLKELGIEYNLTTTDSDNYYDHFNTYLGPLPYGFSPPYTTLISRLIPKSVVSDAKATDAVVDVVRQIVSDGVFLVGCEVLDVQNTSHPDNAVQATWREAAIGCTMNSYWNFTAPLESNLAVKQKMVDTHVPALEAVTPGGGVYMNEMDIWYQGDWKANIYGDKYARLLDIKHKWDPSHLFWGAFAVGSDEMALDSNGRLCN
ncbi:hypothetical protein BKA67DRAFT_693531 [Truncatella angustata]|uniref:FAD-binding PCMH-type domain-containing protein n=1 Tax=Truncatella angustata TaxID=152316 RepID=A0A9P8UHQ2_9PEZI|nr:uncharacterized protein BKA67DRAFT_693531 [Truncatella angustata]KAH6652391.1 hypothetical protein BKA67DRAFT_693531 [Truncatella angustata]